MITRMQMIKNEINNVASSIGNMQDAKGVKSTSISSKYKNGDRVGKTKSHGKHHVRHTVPGFHCRSRTRRYR